MIDVTNAAVILTFIEVESAFKATAYLADRNGGSYGLMQLDVGTARDRGFKLLPNALYDPCTNVRFGVAQLSFLAKHLEINGIEASLENIAAAYNSGLAHVLHGGTDAPYVDKIVAAYKRWSNALII